MRNIDRIQARETRQKMFDINKHDMIDFNFGGKDKHVYSNANLSIFTDNYCNANCKFCVAQLRFENRGQAYKKFKIEDDEEYFKRLEEVLTKVRPLNPSISITGGEPTKCKRLLGIIDLVNKLGFRKRTITTNGSGLLDKVIGDGRTVLECLIENGFSHINISRTHYNDNINRYIMDYDSDNGYFSNEDLKKVIEILNSYHNAPRIRLSCLLLQSGIHDIDGIYKYLDFYNNLGIDNIIFRELMDYDKDCMSNIEKMEFCKSNKVKLNDLWKEFDEVPDLEFQTNILGYYYYVEIYKYKNKLDCVSESADLTKLYLEKSKYPDNVYEMVFHPNGNLNGSWVDNEDILLQYNK